MHSVRSQGRESKAKNHGKETGVMAKLNSLLN